MTDRVVVEVARRGKLVTGEPYFTPGVPVVLDTKGLGDLGPGDLAVVRTGRGRARLERALGPASRIESVLEALLVDRGALADFEPYEAPDPSHEGRVDLRDLTTFTIDPDTAKDFDDALSFRREPDGIRAWVHIADVSYFVQAGTPLDLGAAERALSTYVPGLVAPMLPHELADDLCSLRRCGRGALQVETPEVAFRFEGGRVAAAWLEGEPHAHMLVEELMILANEHVAAFLAGRNREALYRVHERPDPQSVELLLAKLADLGVPTPPAPETLSPETAAVLAGQISERVAEYTAQAGRGRKAFPALVLRALKQARYDPRNLGHSGLASPAYCHFTSPIRRYPDLVVHRALLRELGQGDDPLPDDLPELAEHTSTREREAAQLEYLADDICLAWLLEDALLERGWDAPWEGEITGLIGSGLFARFGEVYEGFLPARKLPGEFFELNPTGTALAGRRSGRAYRLGDPIALRVESIARAEGKVELSPAKSI